MKRIILTGLAAGAFIFMTHAFSTPSLTCGKQMIKLGDSVMKVTKACGSPAKTEKSTKDKKKSTLYYIHASSQTTYEFTFVNGKLDGVEIDPLMD